MKYKLFVNGVDYEDFKTLKELDEYLFEHGTEYQYFIFHKKYTQGRSLEYDYVKEYFKRKK